MKLKKISENGTELPHIKVLCLIGLHRRQGYGLTSYQSYFKKTDILEFWDNIVNVEEHCTNGFAYIVSERKAYTRWSQAQSTCVQTAFADYFQEKADKKYPGGFS